MWNTAGEQMMMIACIIERLALAVLLATIVFYMILMCGCEWIQEHDRVSLLEFVLDSQLSWLYLMDGNK